MEYNLHIGGSQPKAGWKIFDVQPGKDVDFVGDIKDLSRFPDGCFDRIYASHVLEHVAQPDMRATLVGIYRVLKDGGVFMVSVPDLEVLSRMIIDPDGVIDQKILAMRMMFGGQLDAHDFHYFGWTPDILVMYFSRAGFGRIERVHGFGLFHDTSDYKAFGIPVSLNVIAYK